MLAAMIFSVPPPMPDQSAYRSTPFAFDPGGQSIGGVWSPNGKSFAYSGLGREGRNQIFVRHLDSAVSVQLTHLSEGAYPAWWSPDSQRIYFVSLGKAVGSTSWSIAAVGGEPEPISSLSNLLPLCTTRNAAISPDGKTTRPLGDKGSPYYMFSSDGKLIYGIRTAGDRNELFSLNIVTGAKKVLGNLGKDFTPSSALMPGIRFSLAPDGKSFVYGVVKSKSNLWMLEGFEPRGNLLARLAGKMLN